MLLNPGKMPNKTKYVKIVTVKTIFSGKINKSNWKCRMTSEFDEPEVEGAEA